MNTTTPTLLFFLFSALPPQVPPPGREGPSPPPLPMAGAVPREPGLLRCVDTHKLPHTRPKHGGPQYAGIQLGQSVEGNVRTACLQEAPQGTRVCR